MRGEAAPPNGANEPQRRPDITIFVLRGRVSLGMDDGAMCEHNAFSNPRLSCQASRGRTRREHYLLGLSDADPKHVHDDELLGRFREATEHGIDSNAHCVERRSRQPEEYHARMWKPLAHDQFAKIGVVRYYNSALVSCGGEQLPIRSAGREVPPNDEHVVAARPKMRGKSMIWVLVEKEPQPRRERRVARRGAAGFTRCFMTSSRA